MIDVVRNSFDHLKLKSVRKGFILKPLGVHTFGNISIFKGCLIVYYHGALPVDCYYFITWFRNKYRILTRSVVDRFMFNVPGFSTLLNVIGATTGPRAKIVDLLKKGNVVIVSPGGVREALFSKNYEIIWVSFSILHTPIIIYSFTFSIKLETLT